MDIDNLFSSERINFNLISANKNEIIEELIHMIYLDGKITNEEEFKKEVFKREQEFSTGIGMGIAVPHAKSKYVKGACIAFGKSINGVEFGSIDNLPAHYIFLIAVPIESSEIHLKALSQITRKLMHEEIRNKLIKVNNYDEFIEVLK
ncbi:MAG: PTS sugar transporter subunit IIA [Bacillota bacterium]|nr:PTS sugar transporter subunit IIA [Bacillota bacterium]